MVQQTDDLRSKRRSRCMQRRWRCPTDAKIRRKVLFGRCDVMEQYARMPSPGRTAGFFSRPQQFDLDIEQSKPASSVIVAGFIRWST
ncbi:hypothetical protein TNIN_176321 [Trichonephila inaurata madagascariensis]|uniref:Uncharacterized protein n=1 Tax=Trichonephila inaurata madagascariensis TaxID=2747483 RepID=A0A8X6XQ38_9ARAC|nr:hypothetical protein TNIN_176321 [Trichonephila inaurata madagascariensis]